MELIAELEPVKNRAKLELRVKNLAETADWIDVPDSPLGVTRFFSPMISCFIKAVRPDVRVIAHTRLIDINKLAFESIVKTLDLCSVERIVPLRGDIVPNYTIVDDLGSEEAVSLIRSMGVKLSPGLLLSLAKTINEIDKRLKANADFYLVLNLTIEFLDKLDIIAKSIRMRGGKIYPYIIVANATSKPNSIPIELQSKALTREEALAVVDSLSTRVDGILLSSPGNFSLLLETLRDLRRRY